MKQVLLLLVVLGAFSSGNCQIVTDAVFRIFNITFQFGTGPVQVASSQEQVYLNEADATAGDLPNNAVVVENACSTTLHPCDANADCTDVNGTLGIVQCRCRSGFNQTASSQEYALVNNTNIIPDGTNCPDINECDFNSSVCGAGMDQCFNTEGSYSCNCSAGFQYNNSSRNCDDINECADGSSNNCHQNATCTNSVGSFTCACDPGFNGDGTNCTEIADECSERNITCGTGGECVDPPNQRYYCNCTTGYTSNTTVDPNVCEDDDECVTNSDNCDTNAQCTNTDGSFTCACNTGYTGDGTSCNDIDECDTQPCDGNATCDNSPGSFTCTCNEGFSGNGTYCEASTLNYCYRLSITFDEATNGDTASRENDAETAVTGFLNELENGNVGFSYRNQTYTFEAVQGNTSITEFIVRLCLNESSLSPAELTATLQNFNFTTTINGNAITVLEYNECITNYGNCSDDANCTNTDGDFYCTCLDTHTDRSTNGVNGTICDLPTNFTCSSNTVNVTAYNPYFDNLGINYTELLLGSCSGTLSMDDILYAGECDAVVESNDTHLFYKWNLTNVNSTADVTIGNYVTIPITCTFQRSQNVSFNVSADRRDIVFGDDLNNLPGQAYEFIAEAFSNSATTSALSGAINTNVEIFFRLGTSNSLPSNVRMQVARFSTAAADGSSNAIELMRDGCPVTRTNSNGRILDTLNIVRNGQSESAVIGIRSHFFGSSTVTVASFEVNACVEANGANCEYNCNARRKRSIVHYRVTRETVQSGRVTFAFERSPDDECTRDCDRGGLCVYDVNLVQRCVCSDGYVQNSAEMCQAEVDENDTNEPEKVTIIVLIVVAALLVLIIGGLVLFFVFSKRRGNQKQYEPTSYVNTHAIEVCKNE